MATHPPHQHPHRSDAETAALARWHFMDSPLGTHFAWDQCPCPFAAHLRWHYSRRSATRRAYRLAGLGSAQPPQKDTH